MCLRLKEANTTVVVKGLRGGAGSIAMLTVSSCVSELLLFHRAREKRLRPLGNRRDRQKEKTGVSCRGLTSSAPGDKSLPRILSL